MCTDFYPRPPRGGRRAAPELPCNRKTISIHALREEGDLMAVIASSAHFNFYPRPPRGGRPSASPLLQKDKKDFYPRPSRGGRPALVTGEGLRVLFLSTPSARRATQGYVRLEISKKDFYPRPPRGGRHTATPDLEYILQFLSTPSARRATTSCDVQARHLVISIHALREEGDGAVPYRCAST